MKISVIIPNYNGLDFLKRFLRSVFEPKGFTEKEIIIVDNGSSDGSVEWLKDLKEKLVIIELNENQGFSKAVNEGIKKSQGEYVILLNNDVMLPQGFLSKLYKCMIQKQKTFSAQAKMLKYDDQNLIDDAGDHLTILGWTKKRGFGKSKKHYNKESKVFSTCAGAAIYKKSVFDEIGYFDEQFFAYLEDVDIGYRSRIAGYENWYCPDAVCFHVGSGTSGSRYNQFKVKISARNSIYLVYKNMPLVQLILNSPFLILGFLIKWLFFLFKGYGKDYRKGLWEGFTTLKKIKKIPYQHKNLINYLKIEWLLLKNTFTYFF